ncbi:TRAP transporter large permease [Amorphus sp. 3PC139-8]|uniref:TRAP transporter large permease n=1 Tax=Amorphus sp. 3PC139-8 TaxID=2735676 RepID=UPI00345D3D1B
MATLLAFVALVAIVLINVPIGVSLGIVACGAIFLTQGTNALVSVPISLYSGATNFPLIAIPLFILAGAIMNASGISQRLVALAVALVGFVRGALAMVSVGTSLFFAEISGSAVADVAALGSILIPAMRRRGYPKAFAAAVISSSATLAIIIPPSIPMILYAVMSGSSVVQIFVAGIIPGLLGALGFALLSYVFARRYDLPVESRFEFGEVLRTLKEAAWALCLPIIILGTIFGGIVTATEGAAIAVVAALFIGVVVYREFNLANLREALIEGGIQTAVVMLLVAASSLIGIWLTEMRAPQAFAEGIMSLTSNKWAVLALLNLVFLVLGLFLHSAAAVIMIVPIVMPLVHSVGIDPVHLGIVLAINIGIGQQTPPVASVLMATCAIAKANVWEVSRVNVWFVGVLAAILLLCTYVPAVPMFLVNSFYR